MRTYIFWFIIGPRPSLLSVQAKSAMVAEAYAKLYVHNRAQGRAYFIKVLSVLEEKAPA